jgi:hypothetical protein
MLRSRASDLRGSSVCAAILGLVALAIGACSSSNDPSDSLAPDSGSSVIPEVDGSAVDAGSAPDTGVDVEAGVRICSDDGFCHTELPPNQNLRGVWGDKQGTVWAISLEGNILRWDGTAWKIHKHVVDDEGMFGIWGSGPTDVWVASSAGLLHGTGESPRSLTFAPVDLPGDAAFTIKSVWGTGPTDIWAVGGIESYDDWPPYYDGRVLHYSGPSGSGTGWMLVEELSNQGIAFRGVFGSTTSGPWIHGTQSDEFGELRAQIRRRPNGATEWTSIDVPPDPTVSWQPNAAEFTGASLSSDNAAWFSGRTGESAGIWRGASSDNGSTFAFAFDKLNYWDRAFYGFWGTAPNDAWAVGDSGLVMHWDGTGWKQAVIRVSEIPVGRSFWAIWGTSNDDFWVVGDKVALHKTSLGKP